ncbi:hypothetical protein Tco_0150200 [Tanacetum coccineum]
MNQNHFHRTMLQEVAADHDSETFKPTAKSPTSSIIVTSPFDSSLAPLYSSYSSDTILQHLVKSHNSTVFLRNHMLFTIFQRASLALRRLELKDLQVIIDNFPKSDMLELKIFCNRWMRHSIQQKSFLGLLFCPLEVVNEAHDQCMEENKEVDFDGQEVEKDVDYSKEIESHGQHEKKDVKEIELGLWSWDDLNSEGDTVEGVPGVGGDGSNSLQTVDRLSKSDEVGSDNVVRGFKDVKSLSSKQISVSNIVSDNDDMVADSNNSKVGKVCVVDRMVSDPKNLFKVHRKESM